jgi:hypothetical protein
MWKNVCTEYIRIILSKIHIFACFQLMTANLIGIIFKQRQKYQFISQFTVCLSVLEGPLA